MNRQDISKLQKNRAIFLKLGFVIALALVTYAFNYTVYEQEQIVEIEPMEKDLDDIPVVRTRHEEKRLPPPPVLEEVVLPETIETPEFIETPEPVPTEVLAENTDALDTTIVAQKVVQKALPLPPPLPEDPEETKDILFKIVERMPEFGNCNKASTRREREAYSNRNLLLFINKHIKYPRVALENNVSGRVIIRFVVDREGRVIDPHVLRDPGAGLGAEALRVVKMLPLWKPGEQRGRKVKVQFTIPIQFSPI